MCDYDDNEELRLARLRYASVADQYQALVDELLARQPMILGLAILESRTSAEQRELDHLVSLNSRDCPRIEASNARLAWLADEVNVAAGGYPGRYTSELAVLQAGVGHRNEVRRLEALARVERED